MLRSGYQWSWRSRHSARMECADSSRRRDKGSFDCVAASLGDEAATSAQMTGLIICECYPPPGCLKSCPLLVTASSFNLWSSLSVVVVRQKRSTYGVERISRCGRSRIAVSGSSPAAGGILRRPDTSLVALRARGPFGQAQGRPSTA